MPPNEAVGSPWEIPQYENIELRVRGLHQGWYSVEIDSPQGFALERFSWPERVALEELLPQVEQGVLAESLTVTTGGSAPVGAAREVGTALFDLLVRGRVRDVYERSRSASADTLRIVLRIEPAELAALPWELMWDDRVSEQRWVFSGTSTTLIRYVDLGTPARPLAIDPPMRVLAVRGRTLGPLHIDPHADGPEGMINDSEVLQIETLLDPTRRELRDRLWQDDWHVFHFDGHGDYLEENERGRSFIELGDGTQIDSEDLARLLSERAESLRLAVINACEGAKSDPRITAGSLAMALIRRGVPAVVAMQYPIVEEAAKEFNQAFYERLAGFWPVDAAVASARVAIDNRMEHTLQWAVPVLSMHVKLPPDGFLFRPSEESAEPRAMQLAYYEQEGLQRLASKAGRPAAASFTRAIDMAPDRADLYSLRAEARTLFKDHRGAVDDLSMSVRYAPDDLEYRRRRVGAFAAVQDYRMAAEDLSYLIEASPLDPMLYHERGLARYRAGFFALGAAEYDDAAGDFGRAMTLAPCDPSHARALGRTRLQVAIEKQSGNEAKRAAEDLGRALLLSGNDLDLCCDVGIALSVAGRLPVGEAERPTDESLRGRTRAASWFRRFKARLPFLTSGLSADRRRGKEILRTVAAVAAQNEPSPAVARARQQLDFWDLVKLRFDNGVATDAEAVGRVAHLAFEGGDPLVRRDVVAEDGCFDDDSSDHERRSSSNQPR